MKYIIMPILKLIWWVLVKFWLLFEIIWHLMLYTFFFLINLLWGFKILKWGKYISNYYYATIAEYSYDRCTRAILLNETFTASLKRWYNGDYE